MSESEEKTRVTAIIQKPLQGGDGPKGGDCLVVIYTKEPSLLGKRFVLEVSPMRIGRGAENHIVLEGDSVSRRHAHFEQRTASWFCVDDGSTNGSYVNDEQIQREQKLANGDRIKIGPTIFKYLSGHDVEAQYHEEIYRMTIIDGLTQAHVKRYLLEAARQGDHAGAEARARSLVFDVRHRPLQEDQRRPRPPRGRLRVEGARAHRASAHPPRRGLCALRRRGVRHHFARDQPRGGARARRGASARRSSRAASSSRTSKSA